MLAIFASYCIEIIQRQSNKIPLIEGRSKETSRANQSVTKWPENSTYNTQNVYH